MEILCEFSIHIGYRCTIQSQQIPENTDLKFIGSHRIGKSNNDVTEINFKDCTVTKVPQGLTKSFPNLKSMTLTGTKMKKLSKIDLIEYKNFNFFDFSNNKIDFLPDDLFDNFNNLKYISFNGNKLSIIEPNLIDGLNKLETIDLRGDTKYGYMNLSPAAPNWDSDLAQIKFELCKKFCQNSSSIVAEYMLKQSLNVKSLRHENENLTEMLEKLKENDEGTRNVVDELLNQNQNLRIECQLLSHKQHVLESSNTKLIQNNQKLESENRKFKSFLTDETFKDFHIQIDDHNFPVHKFLIAARSPTLAELLKNNPGLENLKLIDIPVVIFEVILKYFYTDELPGGDGINFFHLFAAAGKLKIEELKNFAALQIIKLINAENALEILKLSNKYEHDEMRHKAYEALQKKYPKIKFDYKWIGNVQKIIDIIDGYEKMESEMMKLQEKFNSILHD